MRTKQPVSDLIVDLTCSINIGGGPSGCTLDPSFAVVITCLLPLPVLFSLCCLRDSVVTLLGDLFRRWTSPEGRDVLLRTLPLLYLDHSFEPELS